MRQLITVQRSLINDALKALVRERSYMMAYILHRITVTFTG